MRNEGGGRSGWGIDRSQKNGGNGLRSCAVHEITKHGIPIAIRGQGHAEAEEPAYHVMMIPGGFDTAIDLVPIAPLGANVEVDLMMIIDQSECRSFPQSLDRPWPIRMSSARIDEHSAFPERNSGKALRIVVQYQSRLAAVPYLDIHFHLVGMVNGDARHG